MEAGAAVSLGGTGSPDWNQFQLDILCPLCDYKLRGLSEPRCPECGHRFVWAEVLAIGDRTHPYLFEHQPHRNVWSFRKTVDRSLRPRKFWSDLRPAHPPIVRRIILYWLMLLSGFVPIAAFETVMSLLDMDQTNAGKQLVASSLAVNQANPWKFINNYLTQAELDAAYPRLSWRTFPRMFWRLVTTRSWISLQILPVLVLMILWPWMTLASLLIFRASLGRAKIKTAHVLRCVIYAGDFATLIGLSFLVWCEIPRFYDTVNVRMPLAGYYGLVNGWIHNMAPLILLAIVLTLTYRLAVAYRVYLHFPHAIATAIASQIIVVLTIMNLWMGLKSRGL